MNKPRKNLSINDALLSLLEVDEDHPQLQNHVNRSYLAERMQFMFLKNGRLVDIGGRLTPMNAAMAKLGMEVYVIDNDLSNVTSHPAYKKFESYGVQFIEADALTYDFSLFGRESLDAVVSHHTFEHLHHSPRLLCERAMAALKPGGLFFVETPNACNLRKRIRMIIGKTNYFPFEAFWDPEIYTSHVREFSVGDFQHMAKALQLEDVSIFGMNYFGHFYPSDGRRTAIHGLIDNMLRFRPGLCSSIFLNGRKSRSAEIQPGEPATAP